MLTSKLGLIEYRDKDDEWLIKEQIAILQSVETDMTIFYRNLAKVDTSTANADNVDDKTLMAPLADAYYLSEQITSSYQQRLGKWLRLYLKRVNQEGVDPAQRISRMNSINPKYVLRNYLAQLAIDKSEQGDHSLVNELLEVLRKPYDEQPANEHYANKRPDWARQRPGCSMLSCSS
jgi:uncharacterized protein YdiU (UPF0061 family)